MGDFSCINVALSNKKIDRSSHFRAEYPINLVIPATIRNFAASNDKV